MVKCEALTVQQLKAMCKIRRDRREWGYDKPYSRLRKPELLDHCCGGPDKWVDPVIAGKLPGEVRRQLKRPRGKITGKQFVEWVRDNLEKDGLVRSSGFAGGGMTGWTTWLGSTGYSIRKTEEGDLDMHIVLSGKKAGVDYRGYGEWEDDEYMDFHDPVNPDRVHPKIRRTLERLGLKVKDVDTTGWQTHWDDDINYNILLERPRYLLDK